MAPYFQQLRQLIADNRLDEALQQLRSLLAESPLLDEALAQSGRFQAIRQQIRLGVVSHAEANLTVNQIRVGLLELLTEVEKSAGEVSGPADVALRDEVVRAISVEGSKNVVAGSTISAGGDVHIGDKTVVQNAEKIYNIDKIDNANFL